MTKDVRRADGSHIILDIAMPMIDGLPPRSRFLKGEPSVPITLYTLHKSDQIELEGKNARARSVISKGENSEVLVETIRELLGQAAALSLSIGDKIPAEVDLPKQMLAEPDRQPPDDPDGSAQTDGATN